MGRDSGNFSPVLDLSTSGWILLASRVREALPELTEDIEGPLPRHTLEEPLSLHRQHWLPSLQGQKSEYTMHQAHLQNQKLPPHFSYWWLVAPYKVTVCQGYFLLTFCSAFFKLFSTIKAGFFQFNKRFFLFFLIKLVFMHQNRTSRTFLTSSRTTWEVPSYLPCFQTNVSWLTSSLCSAKLNTPSVHIPSSLL